MSISQNIKRKASQNQQIKSECNTLPSSEIETIDTLSDAGLDAKLQHSYEQSLSGKGRAEADVFDALEKSF